MAPTPAQATTPPAVPEQETAEHGIGRRRIIALALVVTDLQTIHRATLRALLPAGTRRPLPAAAKARRKAGLASGIRSTNRESTKFKDTLRELDEAGLISRSPEYVDILDREALLDIAFETTENLPSNLLNFGAALLAANQRVEFGAALEQRERELAAIRALMQAPALGMHRGRGKARRVGVAGGMAS